MDGKKQIFAAPKDLDSTLTFENAEEVIAKLDDGNVFGHNDWRIGSLGVMKALREVRHKGDLQGTFKTAAAENAAGNNKDDKPAEYWSSTVPDSGWPAHKESICFSDDQYLIWAYNVNNRRLSCRPIRLVDVPRR